MHIFVLVCFLRFFLELKPYLVYNMLVNQDMGVLEKHWMTKVCRLYKENVWSVDGGFTRITPGRKKDDLKDNWTAIQKGVFINTVFGRLIGHSCSGISKHYLGKAGILEINGVKVGFK